mgnify:CR=1 FL=1
MQNRCVKRHLCHLKSIRKKRLCAMLDRRLISLTSYLYQTIDGKGYFSLLVLCDVLFLNAFKEKILSLCNFNTKSSFFLKKQKLCEKLIKWRAWNFSWVPLLIFRRELGNFTLILGCKDGVLRIVFTDRSPWSKDRKLRITINFITKLFEVSVTVEWTLFHITDQNQDCSNESSYQQSIVTNDLTLCFARRKKH